MTSSRTIRSTRSTQDRDWSTSQDARRVLDHRLARTHEAAHVHLALP